MRPQRNALTDADLTAAQQHLHTLAGEYVDAG